MYNIHADRLYTMYKISIKFFYTNFHMIQMKIIKNKKNIMKKYNEKILYNYDRT